MPLIVISAPPRAPRSWEIAQGLVGIFIALREHLVREAALADGYTRGRSDALEQFFWRAMRDWDDEGGRS